MLGLLELCSGLFRAQLWTLARVREMLIAITDLCYMNSQRCDLKAFEYVYLWCEFQLSERLAYSDGPTTLSLSQREFVFIYLWNVRKGGCTALGKPLLAPSTWMSLGFLLNS